MPNRHRPAEWKSLDFVANLRAELPGLIPGFDALRNHLEPQGDKKHTGASIKSSG